MVNICSKLAVIECLSKQGTTLPQSPVIQWMKECDSNMEGLLNMGVYLLQSPGCLGLDAQPVTRREEKGV